MLAFVALLAFAGASAAVETLPTLEKPANQTSTVGKAITAVVVKGTTLVSVTAKELPAGLELNKVSETEWLISGAPTTAKVSTVTLEATNKEGGAATPVNFKWTVKEAEAAPVITKPADQASLTGKAVTPLIITGTNLATLTASGLPAGLSQPVEVKANEWKIEGTPTKAEIPTVTLTAKNAEGTTGTTSFKWTVKTPEALPSITKPSDQTGLTGRAGTVIVTGTNLATLTATGLPAGVTQPVEVKPNEWKIEGVPTKAEIATVTLEAKNVEGAAGPTSTFKWTIGEPEALPTLAKPADQTSIAGSAIAALTISGTNLDVLTVEELPAGLTLTQVSETSWTITGTPTTEKGTVSVTLRAKNKEGGGAEPVSFGWTVNAPPTAKTEAPSTPPPPITKTGTVSAGRLGIIPIQKPGKQLLASFLCEVSSCKVTVTAAITAGKSKFKVHSSSVTIAQGAKLKIALKLTKKQQALVLAMLKKHKKVSASLSATIQSSVGFQATKSLTVAVHK